MRHLLIRLLVNALALWVAAGIVGGIELESDFLRVLVVALIFGLANTVVKPIAVLLSLPFIVVTLGLLLIVINALMLVVTDFFTTALEIDGFGSALLGAVIISIVSWVVGQIWPDAKKHARAAKSER